MDFVELKREFDKQKPEMKPNERFDAYLKGEEVDFLPFDLNGSNLSVVDNLGYTTTQMAKDSDVLFQVVDFKRDVLGIYDELIGLIMHNLMGSETVTQEHGTTYITSHVLKDYKDFDSLPRLDPETNPMVQGLIEYAERIKEKYPDTEIRLFSNGPWSTAGKIRAIEDLLRDTRRHKDELIALLRLGMETNLRFMEYFCSRFGPCRSLMMDPVTCLNLLSKKQFDELSYPYLKEYIAGVYKVTGYRPGLHICGLTKGLWKDLATLDIEYFSVDNSESIVELKEIIGMEKMISGNIPPVTVMRDGSTDDVVNCVRDTIRAVADNPNGFLIDVGCQLPLRVPMENLYAYVYAIRKYGARAKMGQMPKGACTME
ncbi:MAG: uroporphyrinogen decarboxylase family protein [Tissierellia bacterium]|nr:uroporphyrinogen decarboxylase family protein [Tissierellia bacterium]